METLTDFISTSATVWLLIGAFMGGVLGSIITFVVAEKIGMEKGAKVVQRFYEKAYVDGVNKIREQNNTVLNNGRKITFETVGPVSGTLFERI